MRWRKVLVTLLLAFALIATTISLGWSLAIHESNDTIIYSLHLVFALYLFLIAARSITQTDSADHSESILHLTVLISVAFSLLGSTAILPKTPSPVAVSIGEPVVKASVWYAAPASFSPNTTSPVAVSIDDEPVLKGLWYALTAIYAIIAVIAYTTPLGPPLHYPPIDIYSEKTVQSITNKDEDNVCGIISMFYLSSGKQNLMRHSQIRHHGTLYCFHTPPK